MDGSTHPRPAQFTETEWKARVDLACAYRLIAHYDWDDVIYNHATLRVPEVWHGKTDCKEDRGCCQ